MYFLLNIIKNVFFFKIYGIMKFKQMVLQNFMSTKTWKENKKE